MALRWFLGAVSTQIVGQSSGGCSDEAETKKVTKGGLAVSWEQSGGGNDEEFRMPLHYPRYKKADYEKMEEWKVDMLLREYGLTVDGSLEEKREFAMGTFLWPDQLQGTSSF